MPKPKPARRIIEARVKQNIVTQKRPIEKLHPDVLLRIPEREMKHREIFEKKDRYYEVSKDTTRYKSKTDFEKISEIKKQMLISKEKFNATLIQIKDNLRDSRAKNIPNSLPRRSSVLGIINAVKNVGATQFAIAVTDIKTGKVMGYTVIGISKASAENIKKRYNYDLEKSETKFNSTIDKLVGQTENPDLYYEEALKEAFGFNIKHVTMPGYTLDPVTRDFRVRSFADKIKNAKAKAKSAVERIDATSLHPKLKKNR